MNIILLGPPGSGKGTQGKILAEKYGLYYFEAGDFVRELAKKNPRINEIVTKGELIPDAEITAYVVNFLESKSVSTKNILFDGYPRSVKQYVDLTNWLAKRGSKIDRAIFLEISDQLVIQRLSSRRICESCSASFNLTTNPPREEGRCDRCGGKLIVRNDDIPSAIKERLHEYKINVQPLVDYLEKERILLKINGEKSIAEIAQDIISLLKKEGLDA